MLNLVFSLKFNAVLNNYVSLQIVVQVKVAQIIGM